MELKTKRDKDGSKLVWGYTKSAEETKSLGQKVAADLISKKGPTVVALYGDLGAGKTTFTQGFALGLGIKDRIISPTFILMRSYKLGSRVKGLGFRNFYHADLYRLEENVEEEVENLGLKEAWSNPNNIVLIEWAEKIEGLLPKETIRIKFESVDEDSRKIKVSGFMIQDL